ncbi:MAG TPA: hypothetical protein VD997_05030 [Phycisphaerales bacterium]|nr:hypothetical protein [Phycisphaerales bacterium]
MMFEHNEQGRLGRAGLEVGGTEAQVRVGVQSSAGTQADGATGSAPGRDAGGQDGRGDGHAGAGHGGDGHGGDGHGGRQRKPYHVLTREDRSKGGTRSASMQGRDEYGQFAGRQRQQQNQSQQQRT